MTTANTQMVTRCPQCATAFRITSTQLQSAKGAVRCGSCLHVFKALDHIVGELSSETSKPHTPTKPIAQSKPDASTKPQASAKIETSIKAQNPTKTEVSAPVRTTSSAHAKPAAKAPDTKIETSKAQPSANTKPTPTAAPISGKQALAASAKPSSAPAPKKEPVHSPDDDMLISDDMDDESKHKTGYEFDGFLDIDLTPKSNTSLFDREIRDPKDEDEIKDTADESWADDLIDDDDDIPSFSAIKIKRTEESSEQDIESAAEAFHQQERLQEEQEASAPAKAAAPGLVFSLVGEKEPKTHAPQPSEDDFELSEELSKAPSYSGFSGLNSKKSDSDSDDKNLMDPNLFESPDETETANKRQVKTEPKIRAYDNSRTALLMNIIPAPVEFTAKRMRSWYQKKLWPSLSLLALITLITQIGWLKFDYFSRVEPYRTAYTFICPLVGCQVPTLVDTRQVSVFNLVVRVHPDAENALLVDAIILNKAPFDQPFTDLVVAFTDMDEKPIASRRFTPKDYLGGELAGRELMPHNQPIHLTLELVNPGEQAVSYHAYIPY